MTLREDLQYLAYKYPITTCVLSCLTCPITCPLRCWLSSIPFLGGTSKIQARQRKSEGMSDIHFRRIGSKLDRRKSLSNGKPVGRWRRLHRKLTSDQSSSLLFSKLPYEIRALIFEYALTDTGAVSICYGYDHDAWVHSPFTYSRFPYITSKSYPLASSATTQDDSIFLAEQLAIALLRSCRSVYTEALPLLYSKNQFVFSGVDIRQFVRSGIRKFDNFTHAVPRRHLQHIRSLRFVQPISHYVLDDFTIEHVLERIVQIASTWDQLRELHLVFEAHRKTDLIQLGFEPRRFAEESAYQISRTASTHCSVHVHIYHGDPPNYHLVKQAGLAVAKQVESLVERQSNELISI